MIKEPIKDAVCAKTHDPIYTVHRYFARRPHNAIANIINYYLNDSPESLVYDPFGGGGTTLIEALCQGHRVVTSDTSDLAAFVMAEEAAMSGVDVAALESVFMRIYERAVNRFQDMYQFDGKEVYWLMRTTYTECPKCGAKTYLKPETTTGNGNYKCDVCGTVFKPKTVDINQTTPSGICVMEQGSCAAGTPINPEVKEPTSAQLLSYSDMVNGFINAEELAEFTKTETMVPDCNLQRESALHKKGVIYFEQFVPESSRAVMGYIGKLVEQSELTEADKRHLYFILSASLRYCSRFSTINPGWRGRTKPLEWAKSNFWTPYTYVEANPLIGIFDRWTSYKRAVKSAKSRISPPANVGEVSEVLSGDARYAVLNQSSSSMQCLPDCSVDLVVTDPPYGSYLNYGELSAFWTSWLSKYIPEIKPLPDMTEEAVPARKRGYPGWKSFDEYQHLLYKVFAEAHRVMKDGAYCVVTFNNKEPEAWVAFLSAVKRAGFVLPENGVVFQDGVETYRRTIDSRRAGAIFGDFIYSFRKAKDATLMKAPIISFDWRQEVLSSLDDLAEAQRDVKYGDLFTSMYLAILPRLFASIDVSGQVEAPRITMSKLQEIIEERYRRKGDRWLLIED